MPMILPATLDAVIAPVFESLPFGQAMEYLVVEGPGGHAEAAALVADAVESDALAGRTDLIAAMWLYVDELDKAHGACVDLGTPTGAYWHAIVHRREGDFSNALHWFRRAQKHPAMEMIDLTGGGAGSGTAVAAYSAQELVERVQRAHDRGDRHNPALVSVQHKEWQALFNWCVKQGK